MDCRGLEAIGKTRFATSYWAARSVQRNLQALELWAEEGKARGEKSSVIENLCTIGTERLRPALRKFLQIAAPFAKAIQNLESNAVTASDVFLHWISIVSIIKKIIDTDDEARATNNLTDYEQATTRKLGEILTKRYNEMINNAPTDIYITTFFLDPRKPSYLLARPLLSTKI